MDGARNKSVWSEEAWDFDAALTVANFKYRVYALLWPYIGSDDQEPTVNRIKVSDSAVLPCGAYILSCKKKISVMQLLQYTLPHDLH